MTAPTYVTLSSTGSSPWKLVDWYANPINLGVAIVSTGASWQFAVTMDDPTRTYPNPTLSSSVPQTTIVASAVGGVSSGTGNAVFVITTPIAAWQLTNLTSNATVTATVLQAGLG